MAIRVTLVEGDAAARERFTALLGRKTTSRWWPASAAVVKFAIRNRLTIL